MTHEQMMEKAWRFIHELGITDDREVFDADPDNHYLVSDITQVRDCYYADLEDGFDIEGDLVTFFERHNITWVGSIPDYCTQNNGDCKTCSLVNYSRDCMNNPMR